MEKYKETSQKAQEKIVNLQNKEIQYLQRISVLERDWTKMIGDLEVAKGQALDERKKAEEAEEKVKRDVEMAVRCYKRMKAFHREADSNYLTGLNECRAAITTFHLEMDFNFIVSSTNT